MIEILPLLTPDPQRCDDTLTRCHERLARRRSNYLAIERVLIGGLCAIYISGVAAVVIQMLFSPVSR
jgi:hypothetical protein